MTAETQEGAAEPVASPWRKILLDDLKVLSWTRFGLIFVIVLMIVVFTLMNENFTSGLNIRNILRQSAILGIAACGQTMVILSGGFDLSVGMVIGFVSITSALIMSDYGFWAGFMSALLIGAAVGATNGFLVAKAGLPPFIATLAMFSAARGMALIISGGLPVTDLPSGFSWLGAGQIFTVPVPAVIAAAVFVVCAYVMRKTYFGRYIYAIGGNEEAARASGVPVARVKLAVWSFHGFLVGLAAVVLTSRAVSGHATLGEGMELETIAATVIGGTALGRGRGGIFNTFLGVIAMGILTNGLNLINVSTYYQMVVMGVIIAGAVYIDQANNKQR
jgi:ribose/xylose/arabinose/galactoside ABC-type transport system permease subunit